MMDNTIPSQLIIVQVEKAEWILDKDLVQMWIRGIIHFSLICIHTLTHTHAQTPTHPVCNKKLIMVEPSAGKRLWQAII